MVHISEVSDRFIKDINEVLDVGQEVPVKVLAIADDGKISLSIRKAAGQEKKTEVKKAPASYPKKNRQKENKSFDALMNSFLRDSEDRLASLRRNTEGKRGGRGGRRG